MQTFKLFVAKNYYYFFSKFVVFCMLKEGGVEAVRIFCEQGVEEGQFFAILCVCFIWSALYQHQQEC